MEPSLYAGSLLLISRKYKLKFNDVVVLKVNNIEILKRINKIKNNNIFIIGDNPQYSTDSNDFGWIDNKCIQGKIIWPLNINK